MRMSRAAKLRRRTARVRMNNHFVTVLKPKMDLSYEEGIKRIDRILSKKKII